MLSEDEGRHLSEDERRELCGPSVNHAVLLIGYTDDYWIARNNWGRLWGINGDVHISMDNTGNQHCNIDYSVWSIDI